LSGPDDPLLTAGGSQPDPTAWVLRLLLDPGFGALIQSLKSAEPGWLQDSRVSVPELMPRVRERLGVDEPAARLYLQLPALPDPTDKNVTRWNGWSAAEFKAPTAALRSAAAVVDGKRPRAGRSAFLPGGWLDVKAPMLPVEVWKVDLLGLFPDGSGPLGISVPAIPVADLFRRAWSRVEAGDGPRLEQLQTGRRR
jgi:hypothetical protein